MSTCKGCNSRLRKPVGSSGFCDPCYLVVRVERLVFTRCPPHAANDLVDYLKKVTTTLETACEKLESDRTAGFVNEFGEPIPGALDKVSGAAAGGTTFDQGIHPGPKDQQASSAKVSVKEERDTESGKEPLIDAKERGSLKGIGPVDAGGQGAKAEGHGLDTGHGGKTRTQHRGAQSL